MTQSPLILLPMWALQQSPGISHSGAQVTSRCSSGSPGCFCPGLGAISCPGAQLHFREPWHTTSSLPAGKTQTAGFWTLPDFLPCLVPSCFALLQRSLESQMVPKGGGHPWPVWWLCRSQDSAAAGHTGLSKLIAQQSLGRGYHCPEVVLEGDQLEPS